MSGRRCYLKRQSANFLRADCSYSNCLTQKVATVYATHCQNCDVTLPRVETKSGRSSLESFDEVKLTDFLSKLKITHNTPHFVYSAICGKPKAEQIVKVVCSILKDSEFTDHLEQVHSACSLSLRWISIKELMTLVVFAAAAKGIHFDNCACYNSHLGLKTSITT